MPTPQPTLAEIDKIQCRTTGINNRRYLGNKYRLLPFITDVVNRECKEVEVIADIFAGTGAVASAFIGKTLFTNDILYSNYICHYAWFDASHYDKKKVAHYVTSYNTLSSLPDNYMTENFADTYFSRDDCSRIGEIREDIEQNFTLGFINTRERAILITSLLYAMDRIANTCGHYDAYRRSVTFDRTLELSIPQAQEDNNPLNRCYNEDANALVREIEADLVYIDPPYNSRQYCDAYHLLENVATWQKPALYGVARKCRQEEKKSLYCTTGATATFNDLILNIQARYILLSYNNMAQKGNARSNAKINDEEIISILQKRGIVKVFTHGYKSFTTGKSNITNNQERLFLCICDDKRFSL